MLRTNITAVRIIQNAVTRTLSRPQVGSFHSANYQRVSDKITEEKTPLGRFSAEKKAEDKEAVETTTATTTTTASATSEKKKEVDEVDKVYVPFPDSTNPHTGEVGGPLGPEPTRYGDWERKGRVSDF